MKISEISDKMLENYIHNFEKDIKKWDKWLDSIDNKEELKALLRNLNSMVSIQGIAILGLSKANLRYTKIIRKINPDLFDTEKK